MKENRINIFYYVILIIFTGMIGYISLGQGFDFDIIDSLGGDGFLGLALAKGINEHGILGAWFNNRIGMPDGSSLIDFPSVGNIDLIIMWIISWFTDSDTQIVYVFLILSFSLDGIAMSILMRKLNFNREVSFVFSCLFSFAPYHFYRYLGHMSLILYISIPIALYLGGYIIDIINEDKKWKLVLISILLGMGYGYYYAFGLIVLAVAYLVKFIRLENKKEIVGQLWVSVVVLVTIFMGLLPKLIYSIINGNNTEAGTRVFFEQEIYGLKIINLLLPVSYSRIEPFRKLTESYISSGAPLVNENYMASLGLIGSAGFIILCFAFVISFACERKCYNEQWKLIDYLSIVTLTFVLVSAIGGFGEIFNWAVISQIRCYNRSSILMTCTSLMMIAILINKIKSKDHRVSMIICILILGIGMYDQVNICSDNWQEEARNVQEMYEVYFSEVERELDEYTMVYQLPYMEFPEVGNIHNIDDYKLFAGYLFTDNLRWSYGAVKGRNEVSRDLNIDQGMSFNFLASIKNAGFGAVYIDLDGYADGGEQILEFYNGLGIQPIISGDAKLYVYDISKLEISEMQTKPGYSFVKAWADKYNNSALVEEIDQVVEGLNNMDTACYLILFNWFTMDKTILEVTNEEYVDCMYNELLNREESDAEREGWVMQLQNGVSRQDIFYSFLNSEEFRNSKGLMSEN